MSDQGDESNPPGGDNASDAAEVDDPTAGQGVPRHTEVISALLPALQEAEQKAAEERAARQAEAGRSKNRFMRWAGDKDHPWRKHFTVALVLIALALLFGFWMNSFATDKADCWLANDVKFLRSKPGPELAKAVAADDAVGKRLMGRLNDQAVTARERALRHLQIAKFFYVRYFMAIQFTAYLSLIAAICFVWISRAGFKDSNPVVVSLFLLCGVGVAFFGTFPAIYGQKDNLQDNMETSEALVALDARIVTFMSSYRPPGAWSDADDKSWADKALAFAEATDTELARLNKLSVKLSDKDATGLQDKLQGGSPQPEGAGPGDK